MKLKKHIITILLVILLFLLIGSVSATDINTNNTQIASTNGNEILSMENDVNILSAGEYTYTYLREQINSGGNITLIKGNYTYAESDGDTIEITTSRVIDGNGAVIDMAKSGHRAFYITTAGVTIKNLTIKNANYNDDGGAIYFNQLGTVENCNFTNNTATGDGGAVYFNEDGEVTNCNFTNNKATGDDSQGGAIMMYSGEVTNCNFINNTATRHGGAVFFYYDCNVTNCNFINNTATGSSSYGGAIYMSSGNVRNCNFTDNKATGSSSYGGAVYFENYAIVTNCNFTNNTSKDGGAVYIWKDCNVTNCNFTNNTASGNGGAIYFYNYYTKGSTVTNCNFTGNKADFGSAIYFHKYLPTDTLSISNSIFLNNRANAKDLQVTRNEKIITITFTGQNNLLNAIYSRDDAEVTFTNVTYWGANGISNTGSSAIKPSRSNKEAGQNITIEIYDSNDKLVENVTLVTDNNGQITYDLIKLNGKYKYNAYHSEDCYYTYAKYNDTFTLGDFNSLQKYINGASENSILTLCRDYTFTPVLDDNITAGIVIDKQLTINGNGHTINALQKARIFQITAANVVLNNITFTNATYNGNGGAIYFSQSGTVENCNFTNNTATRDGGAIHFNYKSNITNCNFTNNTWWSNLL
ncbi:right-handed parallel beta-helix repeat-containing protein [uncultured Methanobrevibacter sp.]|uniref:right-handed parallel beta-helix repeat-containing protein n=1 Tax=uncultured Methanobrevibacter sp. TaxID=253161 RepID=UPI0025F60D67|nr:right-handed parallel beta-helix repeat-containing protein [uncultured Methanobrevibacter sp.]